MVLGTRSGQPGQPISPSARPSVPSNRQRTVVLDPAPSRAGPAQTSSQPLARAPSSYSRIYRLIPSAWANFVRGSGRVLASTRTGSPSQ